VYLIVTLLNGKQPFNAYTSSFRLDIKCINLTLVKQEKVAIGIAHLLKRRKYTHRGKIYVKYLRNARKDISGIN
jgi:hypothetical protein